MYERADYKRAARWLLQHKAQGCSDAAGMARAVAGVLGELTEGLAMLVGRTGVRGLAARGLQMAQAEYPFLRTASLAPAPGAALEGLGESAASVEPAEACDGLSAILAATLDLMDDLVGADVVARQAHRIWPEMPLVELLPATEVKRE